MIKFTNVSTQIFVWGWIWHLFADWILQSDWLARNKTDLRHEAPWVHSGLHFLGLSLVFPMKAAVLIAVTHALIDTRVPLQWWQRFYRQTTEGDIALHIRIWDDQVLHIVVLAIAAFIVGRRKAMTHGDT